MWELKPQCSGYVRPNQITFDYESNHVCGDLIGNGDMENGITYWRHSGEDITALPGKGRDGSAAIGSKRRYSPYQGIGQYLDTICMKKTVGKTYEFKAWVKLVDFSGNPVECNPSDNHPNRGCPSVTLKKSTLDDTKTTYVDSYQHAVATLLPPYKKGEFNLIHGIIFVDNSMASAESV